MRKFPLKNVHEWPVFFRLFVILTACAVIIYVVYLLDISALYKKYDTNQQKITELNTQIESVIRKQATAKNDLVYFEKLQNIYAEWQKKIVPYANASSLVNELLKIGSYNNLHFNSFSPAPEVRENDYIKIPVKIIAVGDYHQLASFISQVANMPYVVLIGKFAITNANNPQTLSSVPHDKSVEGKLLTAEFNLEVYSLAEKK